MVCRCVRSVLASNWKDLEVIVVDDCSPDDTGKRVGEMFGGDARVRYFRNAENKQLGASRNVGASVSSGAILLFLDDDNIVDKEMIRLLAEDFINHPEAGIIAPLAINEGGAKDGKIWALGCWFNKWTSQPKNNLANASIAAIPTNHVRFPTLYSPNAFAVRRDMHFAVGGFDEELPFYFDESDYGWRIADKGGASWFLSTARTHHQNFLSSTDCPQLRDIGLNNTWRAYLLGRNRLRFVRRHFSLPQILSVMLLFAPLSAVYYGVVAMKNRRPDIAWAYAKGTLRGIFGLK